jgi:large subunit ribosomal protein L3
MRETILGKKLGMTQIFDRHGNAVPVTLVQAGPCTVLQVKTSDSDGYDAIQLGFEDKKEKHTTRPMKGHFDKTSTTPKRFVRESRVEDTSRYQEGMVLTAGIFQKDDMVDVTGTSKGKGFAGVMKRHGFAGFMQTHGVHESFRGPGSIGAAADPARVFPGRRMPGQMGRDTVTLQNLRIVDIREDQNLLVIKGPVPGSKNGLVIISHAIKKAAPEARELVAPEPEPEEVVEETPVEKAASPEPVDEAASPKPGDESADADEAKAEGVEESADAEAPADDSPEPEGEEAAADADAEEADKE